METKKKREDMGREGIPKNGKLGRPLLWMVPNRDSAVEDYLKVKGSRTWKNIKAN